MLDGVARQQSTWRPNPRRADLSSQPSQIGPARDPHRSPEKPHRRKDRRPRGPVSWAWHHEPINGEAPPARPQPPHASNRSPRQHPSSGPRRPPISSRPRSLKPVSALRLPRSFPSITTPSAADRTRRPSATSTMRPRSLREKSARNIGSVYPQFHRDNNQPLLRHTASIHSYRGRPVAEQCQTRQNLAAAQLQSTR